MAVTNRETFLRELETLYVGKYATIKHKNSAYIGIINNINIEMDAVDPEDCTVVIHIGNWRVETSLELFIGNTTL